jgi:hypothetical protein
MHIWLAWGATRIPMVGPHANTDTHDYYYW